jgi:DNA-binding NarL/FixJ family response regulator
MPDEGTRQPPRPARKRVVVLDDHAAMLEHAAVMLRKDFAVVALLTDMTSLLDGWAAAQPDVIVLDISLRRGSGFEACARLRAAGCAAPVVFLSVHQELDFVRAAFAAGGVGYVAKRDMARYLVPAVRAALRGCRYVSPAIRAVTESARR